MCGVFGVHAPDRDVARLTYFGLFSLQIAGFVWLIGIVLRR